MPASASAADDLEDARARADIDADRRAIEDQQPSASVASHLASTMRC